MDPFGLPDPMQQVLSLQTYDQEEVVSADTIGCGTMNCVTNGCDTSTMSTVSCVTISCKLSRPTIGGTEPR